METIIKYLIESNLFKTKYRKILIIFLAVLYGVFSILIIGGNLLGLDFLNNFEKVSGIFINIGIVIYLLLFTSLITAGEQNERTKVEKKRTKVENEKGDLLNKLNDFLSYLNKNNKAYNKGIFANLSLKNTKGDSKSLLNTSFKEKIRKKFPTFDLLVWIDPEYKDFGRLWIYTTHYENLDERMQNIFTTKESYPKSCYPYIDNYDGIEGIEEQLNNIESVLLKCIENNTEYEASN